MPVTYHEFEPTTKGTILNDRGHNYELIPNTKISKIILNSYVIMCNNPKPEDGESYIKLDLFKLPLISFDSSQKFIHSCDKRVFEFPVPLILDKFTDRTGIELFKHCEGGCRLYMDLQFVE